MASTTGSCMCGAIKYEFPGEPAARVLCHCTDCQKWSGSAFTSNAIVPRASFKVTQGTPKTWDAIGDSGKVNKHFFCPTCGSSLYTELEVMPDMTCVKAGGLDDKKAHLGSKIDTELYIKDRVSYLKEMPEAKQDRAMEL